MTITTSYSELSTYRQCPLKHKWAYTERWKKEQDPDGALSLGTDTHTVLEWHYRALQALQAKYSIRSPKREQGKLYDRWAAVCDRFIPWSDFAPERREWLRGMYSRYVGDWGLDSEWKILAVEVAGDFPIGEVKVSEPDYDLDNGTGMEQVTVKFRADLIVFDHRLGGVFVIDNKTTSSFDREKLMELDEQTALYWVAAMLMFPKYKITGAMHNELRKPKGGNMPKVSKVPWNRRTRATHSLAALRQIVENARMTVQAMYSDAPVYATPELGTCGWKCDFLDVHLMVREGLPEHQTLRDFKFTQNFERH